MDSPMNEWVVGFDCGGTSTRAIIVARDGRVLGLGAAGPANYLVVGVTAAVEAICTALAQAMGQAGCRTSDCAAAVVAMAGAGGSVARALVEKLAAVLPARHILVDGDIMAALMGAFPRGTGLVVIAGTGSVAFGVAANGERVQVGGWGYILGDEGSGYAIGLEGLRRVLRYYDGRDVPTTLAPALLAHVSASSPAGLVRRVYVEHMTRDEIAALAPLIAAHAAAGDVVAERIILHAGGALAGLAATGVARLAEAGTRVDVAVLGGLFSHIPMLTQAFRSHMGDFCPGTTIVVPRFDAVGGAALMALREAGTTLDDFVLERLSQMIS